MDLYQPEYVFKVGGFGLRWYSALVAIGVAMGAWAATFEARRRNESTDHVFNILLISLPLALIGARAYHVIDLWSETYSRDLPRIFLINEGGIGIYGAVAGSILGVFIYTRWKHLPFSRWLDICAPGLILGQAIGRWGNFFNQELYGKPTDLPWAIEIDPGNRLLGYETFDTFHPLFLYESLLNLIGFGALMYLGRRWAGKLKDGDIALMYGMYYGAVRLGLETLRLSKDQWTVGDVSVATIISASAIAVCGAALLYRHWWQPRMRKLASASE